MGFFKWLTVWMIIAMTASAQPKMFLPLEHLMEKPVIAYVDQDLTLGSIATWQGPGLDMCVSWTKEEYSVCIGSTYDQHTGIDYDSPNDWGKYYSVHAVAGGVISFIKDGQVNNKYCGCYGNWIKIDHGNGWETRYAHLDSISDGLYVGKKISVHEYLGMAGNTGQSEGHHLHFEIRYNGKVVDPYVTTSVWCGGSPQFYAGQPCDQDTPTWHPAGTILHVPGTVEYYSLGEDGSLHHIANEQVYLESGYNWDQAIDVTFEELACYLEGNAVESNSVRNIVLEKTWLGLKKTYWFYEHDIMHVNRYRKKMDTTTAELVAQSWGLTLPLDEQNTQFIIDNYNIAPGKVQLRNGTLFKTDADSKTFVMENGKRRWIEQWSAFVFAGYESLPVMVIPSNHLNTIGGTIGENITMTHFTQCMLDACNDNVQTLNMLCPGNTNLDADLDGAPAHTDCNDADPKISPDFSEECDGIDNNCNGEIDEKWTCGFSIAGQTDEEEPDDSQQSSCDSSETCFDLIDNNCNGIVDEGCGPCGGKQEGEGCNDENPCTINDICIQNVCFGEPNKCDDGNWCTTDSCKPDTGCTYAFNNLICDPDGNPCTDDRCVEGVCTHPPADFFCGGIIGCFNHHCTNGQCIKTFICECQNNIDCTTNDLCTKGECIDNVCVQTDICTQEETTDPNQENEPDQEQSDTAEETQNQEEQTGGESTSDCTSTQEEVFSDEETSSEETSNDQEDQTQEEVEQSQENPSEENQTQSNIITLTWHDPTIANYNTIDMIGCVGMLWDSLEFMCTSEWKYSSFNGCLHVGADQFVCDIDMQPGSSMKFNIQFFPAHNYGGGYMETYVCGMNGNTTGLVSLVDPSGRASISPCTIDSNNNFNIILTMASDVLLKDAGGLLQNGSFENSVLGWFPEIHEWNSAHMTLDCDQSFDGVCSMHTAFSGDQAYDYHVQLVSEVSVQAGKQYMLTFAAKADKPRVIRAWLGQETAPYNVYGLNHTVQLTNEWKLFTLVFTSLYNDAHAKLAMVLGQSTESVWIDAVNLTHITP